MSNNVYVLAKLNFADKYDPIEIKAFSDKDIAISTVMEEVFGEDWEAQIGDDEWEEQGKLLDAYDALQNGLIYSQNSKVSWKLEEVEVEG